MLVAQPNIGLLPLYLALYDEALPAMREQIEAFYAAIATALQTQSLAVQTVPICRKHDEFQAAVTTFEQAGVDAIVTLHLAYSPSLESATVLAATSLPVIVLDTTPAYEYGPRQDPDALLYNHGIHGVQDLCNMLIRLRKPFRIEVGHWEKSDVLERVAGWARAARMATVMRTARVGRIGEPFAGMGDFAVPAEVLHTTLGVETVACDAAQLRAFVPEADAPEVEAEIAADTAEFLSEDVSPAAHRRSVQAGLAVRRWIEQERLTAFSVNFLAIDQASGIPTVPFLAAGKAMARGIGYAGEGDVLTAALVGALASVFPETSFTEMFCPDWACNSIYLSHMGEMNFKLCAVQPRLREMPFPYTDAENPVIAVGCFKPGRAALVNLAPMPGDRYRLLLAPVTMLEVFGEDRMADAIHGWFTPDMPIADFLADYSRNGGTHHAALVYGHVVDVIAHFGHLMDWEVMVIGSR